MIFVEGLPPKREDFDARLAELYTHHGKPLFRLVDGRKETQWLNGNPKDIKHWDIDPKKGRVPRQCWVIEYYQSPREIDPNDWATARYQQLSYFGGEPKWVDVKGPYPTDGRYLHFRDLRDANKVASSPDDELLSELKTLIDEYFRGLSMSDADQLNSYYDQQEDFEKMAAKQYAENFYQAHGLAAIAKFHNTAVSRPMRRIWLPGDN
jgi:hypothetical protein